MIKGTLLSTFTKGTAKETAIKKKEEKYEYCYNKGLKIMHEHCTSEQLHLEVVCGSYESHQGQFAIADWYQLFCKGD